MNHCMTDRWMEEDDMKDTMRLTFLSLTWNVWMADCEIGARGVKRIAEMLEQNTSLKTLYLFGEIPFNIHSPSISFWSNVFGSRCSFMGEVWLIACLIFMVLFVVCWIAGNDEIGVDGASHILHGLEKSTSLTQLVFYGAFLRLIVHLLWRLSCMLEGLLSKF